MKTTIEAAKARIQQIEALIQGGARNHAKLNVEQCDLIDFLNGEGEIQWLTDWSNGVLAHAAELQAQGFTVIM